MKPYTSIVLKVLDDADLLNRNVGLDGLNSLSLSFNQPGQPSYDWSGILTSVEKARSTENQRAAYYTMTGYSSHMLNHPKVQKSYKDISPTDVVSDLVSSFLKSSKPLSIRAPARGMIGNKDAPYIVNGVGIHKAIRGALLRAASTTDQSSAYLIFENRTNLVVDTIERMLSSIGGGPVYYQRPLGIDFLRDTALQQYTIISMREEARIDTTSDIQNQDVASNVLDLFGQSFKGGSGGGSTSYVNIPYNLLAPPTYAAQFMGARKRAAGKADGQAATIHVALNTRLTVGDSFVIHSLAPAGDTDTPVEDALSGPLLATEVRHTGQLDQRRMQGTSTVKGIRGGLI